MKNKYTAGWLLTGVIGAFFMMPSIVAAADRVVVVPLGGKKCPNSAENIFTNSIGMTFNLVPAGTFTMGSPVDESETQHQVTLTKSFYMQTTEVTQAQWDAIVVDQSRGNNPSSFSGEGHPVERVSWYEAASFANWLSYDEGLTKCYDSHSTCTGTLGIDFTCTNVTLIPGCTGYRLPTEAQWEYAARAGSVTAFYSGDITNTGCTPLDPNLDTIGWYCGNADSTTHFVRWKQPNAWGLYDMSGNVWEWCQDWYDDYPGDVTDPQGPADPSVTYGFSRVIRGGSWNGNAGNARSARRSGTGPGTRRLYLGFRLVLPPGQ